MSDKSDEKNVIYAGQTIVLPGARIRADNRQPTTDNIKRFDIETNKQPKQERDETWIIPQLSTSPVRPVKV